VSAFRRTFEVRLKPDATSVRLKAGLYIGPVKAGRYNLLKIALKIRVCPRRSVSQE
jgi:hypothetical protein